MDQAVSGERTYLNTEVLKPISDKQHTALFIGMGGLTPCMDVVERVLAPLPGKQRQVLDVGLYQLLLFLTCAFNPFLV